MRRKNREITDINEIERILTAATVCRLALNGADGYPYILPMNYGLVREGDQFCLYFHCAREGTKLDLMGRDPRVSFEVDGAHRLYGDGDLACTYGYAFESVIGQGTLEAVEGLEKRKGLEALMQQLRPGETFTFSERDVEAVAVLCLRAERMTAKRNMGPGA